MVDYTSMFKAVISKSNDKQNSYLSNIFGVGGGAVMYTIWQMMLSEDFSPILTLQVIAMLVLSLSLLFVGYILIGSKDATNIS